ncbi:MAG TPA: response regulator [Lacipirellula sp.]
MTDLCAAIVDDEEHVRVLLEHLLNSAGIAAQTFESAEHLLAEGELEAVSCLILDIGMSGMSGLELMAELRGRDLDFPIVIASGQATIADANLAIRQRVGALFEKPFDEQELLAAVKELIDGWAPIRRRSQEVKARLATLTLRERDVMQSLVAGKKTVQIANELLISPSTVEKHRLRVFHKTGVDSVVGLMNWLAG